MEQADDSALLRRYVEDQSDNAFAAMVTRHISLVYSVALRRTGCAENAEEITQAVFIILARKARHLRHDKALSSWLFQTTRLTANNFLRSEMRRQNREQEAYMQSVLNQEEDDLWPKIAPLLDSAVASLRERDRRAILLRFYEQKNLRDVGHALGTTQDAAEKRVSRALEKLRGFFARRGVDSTTAIISEKISMHSVQAAPVMLARTVTLAAAAKGAAASTSTLTLIKGAMKIMAWTKAKTTVIAALAVVAAGGLGLTTPTVVHRIRVARYPDIQGTWEGSVHLDDAGVGSGTAAGTRVVFKFKRALGVYTATTDWIDSGRKDVRMLKVVYDYPSLTIQATPRDTWSLKVNDDATEILWDHNIHFIQTDPATFKRTTKPDSVPDRLAEDDFAPRTGSDLQGYWKGFIGTGAQAVPVDLKIAEDSDETFRAEGDIPTLGRAGAPVTVSYNHPNVTVAVATGAGRFDGTIDDAKTEIVGTFTQNGKSIPATIRRADYQAEHAHDAEKDYSFHSSLDLQGHWKGTWIVIFNGGKTKVPIREALDIAKLPDGSYSAALVDLDGFLNSAPIPPSSFEYSPPNLKLKWNETDGAYEAELQGGKLIGTWSESGGGFPLVMERTALN